MKKIILLLSIAAVSLLLHSSLSAQSTTPLPTDDLSQYKTADELWNHIQKVIEHPGNANETPEERRKSATQAIETIDRETKEFFNRYPQDPRRWDLQLFSLKINGIKQSLGLVPLTQDEYVKELSEIANAQDASQKIREAAASSLVAASLKDSNAETVEMKISEFESKFPQSRDAAALRKLQIAKLQQEDPLKASALLQTLSHSNNKAVAQMATTQLAMADLLKKPLDLKFTALDGSTVDLAKLRGKVVLLDFWATWCGPCVGEVPHVVETYKALHDKGFEIVGISLDKNKEALEQFIKKQGMPWPQYFDGKGWQNAISSKFGIHSIPAMWLVDKKGMIVDTNARKDLTAKVQEQLEK